MSVGYLAGSHIDTVYQYITEYSFYLLLTLAVLLAAYCRPRAAPREPATPAREQAGQRSDGLHR